VAPPVELIVHDIVHDPLPRGDFDLVHARAVLQHVPERDDVVATLLGAARPGGALLLEEGDFRGFVEQPLPEPYGTVHRLMNDPAFTPWREPSFGTRLPALLRDLGAVDIDVHGDAWAMRPGTAAGDWWFLAVAETLPKLVDAGVLDAAGADAVQATITDPDLVIVSPVSLAISARRAAP
jgi:SAM-dependent methyltransferase